MFVQAGHISRPYPFPRIRTNSLHVLRTSWHPHSGIRGTNSQDTTEIMTKKLLEAFDHETHQSRSKKVSPFTGLKNILCSATNFYYPL